MPGAIADDDGVPEQAVMIEAADDGGLRGQPNGFDAGDADQDQEVGPGVLVGEDPALVRHQPIDQEFRSLLFVKPDQSGAVDHVVRKASPERHQEHQPALAGHGVEAGETVITDLCGGAVDPQMPGAGVIDGDPARRRQPGLFGRRLLGMKGVVILGQQVGNLPGRDQQTDILKLLAQQSVHATSHVSSPHRQPNPRTRRNRDHRPTRALTMAFAKSRDTEIGIHTWPPQPVTVYRLIVRNSIEEKIIDLHRAKRDLASDLLEGSEISAHLTDDDLLDLIRR